MEKERQIEQWIDLYTSELYGRAIYLISDKEDAKDILQEVFLAAYTGFDRFEGGGAVKTWLFSILKHKVADYYRKKYKDPIETNLEKFFDSSGVWLDNKVLLKAWDDAVLIGNNEEFDKLLEICIENLSPKWKLPLKMYYLEEKKTPEVCQEIGVTTTNLWKILQRARMQIRECLESNYEAND